MKILGYICAAFLNWTWGILQTLAGFCTWVYFRVFSKKKCKTVWWKGQPCTYVPGSWGGITLGWFTFVDNQFTYDKGEIANHEHGHTLQSILLGPLWIFIIALPSLIWCGCFETYRRKNNVSYYWFFSEKWANAWGGVKTK